MKSINVININKVKESLLKDKLKKRPRTVNTRSNEKSQKSCKTKKQNTNRIDIMPMIFLLHYIKSSIGFQQKG